MWTSLRSHYSAHHTQHHLAKCLAYNMDLRMISCYDVTIVVITSDSKEYGKEMTEPLGPVDMQI